MLHSKKKGAVRLNKFNFDYIERIKDLPKSHLSRSVERMPLKQDTSLDTSDHGMDLDEHDEPQPAALQQKTELDVNFESQMSKEDEEELMGLT